MLAASTLFILQNNLLSPKPLGVRLVELSPVFASIHLLALR